MRDVTGLNGLTEEQFDKIKKVSDYNDAISRIKQPGADNGNYAKKLYNTDPAQLVSKLWYFEFRGGKTALAKITDYRYLLDGYVTIEVKQL